MALKSWNICTKKDMGEGKKPFWPSIGRMVYFPPQGEKKGNYSIELNMFPNTKFYVFEIVPKQDEGYQAPAPDDISASDVPY